MPLVIKNPVPAAMGRAAYPVSGSSDDIQLSTLAQPLDGRLAYRIWPSLMRRGRWAITRCLVS